MKFQIAKVLVCAFFFTSGAEALANNPCNPVVPDNAIWLADQFPGISGAKYFASPNALPLEGAPNFRRATLKDDGVYGMGQPTLAALEKVMNFITDDKSHAVFSINLRQESFLYINGASYSLRDPEHPIVNFLSPGETTEAIEKIEKCLVKQVKAAAAKNGGRIRLFDEAADYKLQAHDIPLTSVMTVKTVYRNLKREGYRVHFYRVPAPDEKSFASENVAQLLAINAQYAKAKPQKASLVVNCQAGHGRTTQGLALHYIGAGESAEASVEDVGRPFNLRLEAEKAPKGKELDYQERYFNLLKISKVEAAR